MGSAESLNSPETQLLMNLKSNRAHIVMIEQWYAGNNFLPSCRKAGEIEIK